MSQNITPEPNTGLVTSINKIGFEKAGMWIDPASGLLELRDKAGSSFSPSSVAARSTNSGITLSVYKESGLDSWKAARNARTPVGGGGAGIVFLSNSIFEGGIVGGLPVANVPVATPLDYLTARMSHLLAKRLAAVYNQNGRTGLGWVPHLTGALATDWLQDIWTKDGTFFAYGDNADNLGQRITQIAAAASGRLRFAFDPAIHPDYAHTTLEPVYAGASGTGVLRWDLSSADAFVSPGAGTIATGLIPTVNPVLGWGYRFGSPPALTNLDRSQARTLQYTNASVGANQDIFVSGVFHYDGDETSGVSVYNYSNWGNDVNFTANTLTAAITRSGSMAGPYASTRAGLVIGGDPTNDITAATPLATFKTRVFAEVDAALACPSAPSVLLCAAGNRGDYTPNGGSLQPAPSRATYASYVQVLREVADARPHTAVVDLAQMVGFRPYGAAVPGAAMYDKGWRGDGVHYPSKWQDDVSAALAEVLMRP